VFPKSVAASSRNVSQGSGFHRVSDPTDHQFATFGEITKNLREPVAVCLDGIHLGKMLVDAKAKNGETRQTNPDLLEEKGAEISHGIRW
jgi:hypothetical protein